MHHVHTCRYAEWQTATHRCLYGCSVVANRSMLLLLLLLLHSSSLIPSFYCACARRRARPLNCSLVGIWSVCALCTECVASTNMRPSSNSIRPPICSPPPRAHENFVIYLPNLHVGIQLRQPCLHVCVGT